MEEKKKFDVNSFIGFVLIGIIILYLLSTQESDKKQADKEAKANTESVEPDSTSASALAANDSTAQAITDTTGIGSALDRNQFGLFHRITNKTATQAETITLENEVLKLKFSNKGGQVVLARLKGMKTFDSLPIYLVKDNNARLNLKFTTNNNRIVNTKDLRFEPQVTQSGDNTILTMTSTIDGGRYIKFIYTIKPDEYLMDFNVKSHGLKSVINQSEPITLNWELKSRRLEESLTYENRYTTIKWMYEGDKLSYQRTQSKETDKAQDITWVAYRQHLFTSILIAKDAPFESGEMHSVYLPKEDQEEKADYLKDFSSTFPIQLDGGEFSKSMSLYYGPNDYNLLKHYEKYDLGQVTPLGWWIFGWLNRTIIIPIFNLLVSALPAGIAIILLTIIIKLLLSPVQYKQFLSQAKRQVLQPEINELNEKYKDNKMKLQQETMKLNKKAGINMTSGCLVGLMQAPIFYAMFRFFPSAFQLRHESFLWADNLASFDVIAQLPFNIPFYGSHVSLFPILAAVAIFFYMLLTTGQNMQQQPGMPNMKFIMYLSPLAMLFFFNSYASGLSLYYFISNSISIVIVLFIQKYIIDKDKIHAQIQVNKKKPRKQNRFQRKMSEMMEEAEKQQKNKKK